MSLAVMDLLNPQNGFISWNDCESEFSCGETLFGFGKYNSLVGNSIFKSTSGSTDIPIQKAGMDSSGKITCIYRTDCIMWPYSGTVSSNVLTISSPYPASTAYTNTNGYVSATTGKSYCDFNGVRNTAALYVATRTNSQWTASTISDNYTSGTPAAACCGRFKTVGTKSFYEVYKSITSNNTKYGTSASTKDNKGFWYLPAARRG